MKCQFCSRPASFEVEDSVGRIIYLCGKHRFSTRFGRVPVPIQRLERKEKTADLNRKGK